MYAHLEGKMHLHDWPGAPRASISRGGGGRGIPRSEYKTNFFKYQTIQLSLFFPSNASSYRASFVNFATDNIEFFYINKKLGWEECSFK